MTVPRLVAATWAPDHRCPHLPEERHARDEKADEDFTDARLDGCARNAVVQEPHSRQSRPGVDSVRITPETCFAMCCATALAVRKFVRV